MPTSLMSTLIFELIPYRQVHQDYIRPGSFLRLEHSGRSEHLELEVRNDSTPDMCCISPDTPVF